MNKFEQAWNYLTNRQVKVKESVNEMVAELPRLVVNKIIYNTSDKTCQVIIGEDILIGNNIELTEDLKNQLKIGSYDVVKAILTPKPEVKKEDVKEEIVNLHLDAFEGNDDFEMVGNSVFFKGIKSIEIPKSILAVFVELIDKMNVNNNWASNPDCQKYWLHLYEEYETMKAFTYWLLLNPIESSRNDALRFVKQNDLPMTSNGMLITYRKVVPTGNKNKKLTEFISSEWLRIKKMKKSPMNYMIYKNGDDFICKSKLLGGDMFAENLGILGELYYKIDTLSDNTFTDSHTQKKSIKIGQIYREDEDKINLDNSQSCGAGLHVGSSEFGSYDSFGSIGLMCLVNPSKIRSVPNHDCNKMRVSELLPVAIMGLNDYKDIVDSKEITDLSELYFNESIDTLKEQLANKSFEGLACQEHLPQVSLKEIENITDILKNRIISLK